MKIRKLKDGEKVKEPGVYAMDINQYHSDCADAPSFSSGELVEAYDSGEEFWDGSKYNPDSTYFDKTDADRHQPHFHFGNAAHGKIIGHEEGVDWNDSYVLRPTEYKTWGTKGAKDWRVVQERQGLTCYTTQDITAVDAMAQRILDDDAASELFQYGHPELSLFVKFEDIWIKSRPDVIPIYDWTIVSDYKTTYNNSIGNCMLETKKYHYAQKLANIAWCMYQLPDEFEMPTFDDLAFSLFFQKSSRPYGITPLDIPNTSVWQLVSKNIKAAQEIAHGLRTGQWRGFTEKIEEFKPNKWETERIEQQIASGELPTLDNMMKLVTKDKS